MTYSNIVFDKNKTAIIKGFAIVFMIILHVFGGPGHYDADIPMNHNATLLSFMEAFKICVGIYLFMIGYGYAHSKNKDFDYSAHHIKKLLTVFWVIFFCFFVPAGYKSISSGEEFIKNLFGISSTLCWVSWFVYFYIWAMVIMPFAGRLIDRRPFLWTGILMVVGYACMVAVHELIPDFTKNDWTQALFDCLANTPLMLLGYLFARKKWFEKIRIPEHWTAAAASVLLAAIVLIARSCFHRGMLAFTELAYAPMMIFSILVLFTLCHCKWLEKIMQELGDKSVYMWFFHALFFTAATRGVYGHFFVISDNLWITAVWTILLSYICSAAIKKIVEY